MVVQDRAGLCEIDNITESSLEIEQLVIDLETPVVNTAQGKQDKGDTPHFRHKKYKLFNLQSGSSFDRIHEYITMYRSIYAQAQSYHRQSTL